MPKDSDPTPDHQVEQLDVESVRPLRHSVLRPGQPDDSVDYQSDGFESARHFGVRDAEGTVIGVGSVHQENRVAGHPPHGLPGFRVRGMAVEETWRGKGVGRAILAQLIDVATTAEAGEIWANARVESMSIYSRSGFANQSSEFDIPTIGPHIVVVKRIKPARRKPSP